jgi:hypothetical protein
LRQLGFRVVLIALAIALVEGACFLLLRFAPELGDRMKLVAEGLDPGARAQAVRRIGHRIPGSGVMAEVIHPYLGFAVAPPEAVRNGPLTLESLGFPSGGPLVRERRPDTVVMAIFGGSVAYYFTEAGGPQRIFDGLQELPAFAGKQLVVLGAAHIGYKQPQALLSLAWLAALGVEIDVVVLLDGFNEVNAAPAELRPAGVFPFFPGRWHQRVANLDTETGMRSLIGEIAYVTDRRSTLAARFANSPLSVSRTATLLWALYDRQLERTVEARRRALAEGEAERHLDYATTGPAWPPQAPPQLFDDLAAFWMESSLAMHALAVGKGAHFFHFLQPNQHLPGSKPMTGDEIAVAITGGESFAPHIARGYPLLRERGAELVARGVRFHDLTLVFEATHEPVYVDNIGHVGPRGNEIIADAIAARIRDDLAAAEP